MTPEIDSEDYHMKNIMDDVYDEALEKLSRLERAAIFRDFEAFKYEYRKEQYENI